MLATHAAQYPEPAAPPGVHQPASLLKTSLSDEDRLGKRI